MTLELIDLKRTVGILPQKILNIVNGLYLPEKDKNLLLRDLAYLNENQRKKWIEDLMEELDEP